MNAHTSWLPGVQTAISEPPEEPEHIEEIDSGDEFLQAQDNETGGDGLLHDNAATSQTGEGHRSGNHDWTDNNTDHNLPDTDSCQSVPASRGVRSRPPAGEDIPPVSRDTVVHNRHLCLENAKAHRTAAMTKQSCQPPPHTPCATRSHIKISANALIFVAKAPLLTSINIDRFIYAEAMDSPQQNHSKQAMAEECTSILLNKTYTTIIPLEARQFRVQPIGSKWVCMMKHNPDSTIQYNAQLENKVYEKTDFTETYPPVGMLPTFQYLIPLVGKHGWNIPHLDVVGTLRNPEVNDVDICMMLLKAWPAGLNTSVIVVQLKNAFYCLKDKP
jgi:hypothetical protein